MSAVKLLFSFVFFLIIIILQFNVKVLGVKVAHGFRDWSIKFHGLQRYLLVHKQSSNGGIPFPKGSDATWIIPFTSHYFMRKSYDIYCAKGEATLTVAKLNHFFERNRKNIIAVLHPVDWHYDAFTYNGSLGHQQVKPLMQWYQCEEYRLNGTEVPDDRACVFGVPSYCRASDVLKGARTVYCTYQDFFQMATFSPTDVFGMTRKMDPVTGKLHSTFGSFKYESAVVTQVILQHDGSQSNGYQYATLISNVRTFRPAFVCAVFVEKYPTLELFRRHYGQFYHAYFDEYKEYKPFLISTNVTHLAYGRMAVAVTSKHELNDVDANIWFFVDYANYSVETIVHDVHKRCVSVSLH